LWKEAVTALIMAAIYPNVNDAGVVKLFQQATARRFSV